MAGGRLTHQGEEEAEAASQAQEEEHLSPAAADAEGPALHGQMSPRAGGGDERVAGLGQGQRGQEAVHGRVKAPARVDV